MTRKLDFRLRDRIRLAACGATTLVALSYATGVIADAAGASNDTLEEVTVTAQRRQENSRDVPISLTVFDAAAIEQQNFQGVENYFDQTPNVSFTSEGTRDRKELALRGISDQLSPDNNIKEGSFGFYIDDFNVAQGTSNPEIVDIDRIEVLRGPQGTYFGRNAVGGAINIVTKQPTNDFFAEASSQYSSFNTVDTHAIVNLPLIDNLLAVRMVGRDETSDGNIRNDNAIGGGNNSKYTYGKVIVRFTPTGNLTIDTTGMASNEVVGMRNGVPSGVFGDFGCELYGGSPYSKTNPGYLGPTRTPFVCPFLPVDPDGLGVYPNNVNTVNFNRGQGDGTHFSYVTNRVKYAAEEFTVTNVVGYLYSNEFEGGDIDGSGLDLFYESESIKRSSISEELRIQSVPATGRPFDWTGGFYYGHDYGHVTQYTYAGSAGGALFGLPEGYELTSSLGDSSDFSDALFGEVIWHAAQSLSLTLGARYTHENVSNDGYNTSGTQVLNYVNGSVSFNNFSPRLTALYAIDNQTNLYATISRGFKAGGVEAQPVAAGGNQVYKPETLWNYEFGVKSESADKRLRLDADVFLMDWKDIQADYAIGQVSGGGVSFITGVANAASARSYGFETEATALVATGLTVDAGAGYDRAYYVSFPNAESGLGTTGDLSGATLPNSPKWTLHADSQYTRNFTADQSGFLRLEWHYKGGIKSDQNSEFHTGFPWDVPSYNLWNLRAGYTRGDWTVTAFDENVLNKKYYTNAYEKAFVDGMFIEPGYRNIGVRVTVRTR
jgi:iron complex outermembrane receptor protein